MSIGKIENGKFVPNNSKQFINEFAQFEGKQVEVTVKRWYKKRSLNQNDYYWGVIIVLITNAINELGNEFDSETVHEYLKGLFLKDTKELIDKNSGETKQIEYIKTTTKLTTVEFETYLEKCRQFAAEQFDTYIPNPNE